MPISAHNWIALILRGKPPFWPTDLPDNFVDTVYQEGASHGVLALLHYTLAREDNWGEIPECLRNHLANYAKHEAAKELAQKAELENVLANLEKHHIKNVLLKGTPLAYSLYPEPYLRVRCDTDVLFPDRENAEKAGKILVALGYASPNAVDGEYISHELMYWKPGRLNTKYTLDLHWKLNNLNFFANSITFDKAIEESIAVPALKDSAITLAPYHALLLACIHRIAHVIEGNANRLIWLYDIHLLCESLSKEGWEKFLLDTKGELISAACLDSLRQCKTTLGTKIPEAIENKLSLRAKKEVYRWNSNFFIQTQNFRSLPDWASRTQLLREHLIPSASYIKEKYQIEKTWLLPYYYIHRIFAGIWKLLKS